MKSFVAREGQKEWHMADPPAYPGTPRWAKVSGIIGGILVLLVVILILAGGGGHGPGRHTSGSSATEETPAPSEGGP